MIFRVCRNYINGQNQDEVVLWLEGIIRHRHFLDTDSLDLLGEIIKARASSLIKELWEQYCRIPLTDLHKKYLTIIDSSAYTIGQLITLSGEPAYLVLENLREFTVYMQMIEAYRKDPKWKCLFEHLRVVSQDSDAFNSVQAGGWPEMTRQYDHLNNMQLKDVAALKVLFVFDRDTESGDAFDPNKTNLFYFLCRKYSTQVTNDDVYCLNQSPYRWHMWYRRAIENYFPNDQFLNNHCRLRPAFRQVVNRDWMDAIAMYDGYTKNKLEKLPRGMTRALYEDHLPHFSIGAETVSELQLFLLKLIQII